MARLKHLVVVVPGIGGSALGPPAGAFDAPWTGVGYGLTFPRLARVLAFPDVLDLERYPDLVPTGLVRDLAVLPPLLTLPGYQRIDAHLRRAFDAVVIDTYRPPVPLRPDADVIRFPYDFRRSIAEAAQRLDDAIGEALRNRADAGPQRPVILLAHSMGGLVARYWLAVFEGWRRCQALIGLGVPHRGAPKALDWLANGVQLGGRVFSRATEVVRGWPSVYELLPRYPAVFDTAAGEAVTLSALPPGLITAQPGLAAFAPRFEAMTAAAATVHDRIRAGLAALDPAESPTLVTYLARGHATPNAATLDGGRLRVTKDDPPWRGNAGWRGDGTVPALSAIAQEQGGDPHLWRVVGDRHGPLGSIGSPIEVLRSYAGDPVPVLGGGAQERPWLGLDIEEFAEAGVPGVARFSVEPVRRPGGQAWLTVTALDGTAAPTRVPADPAGDRDWRVTVPALPSGRYEAAFEVMDVPDAGSVYAAVTLVVLDARDKVTG